MVMRKVIDKFESAKVVGGSINDWDLKAGLTDRKYIDNITGAIISDVVIFEETTDDGRQKWATSRMLDPYTIPAEFVEKL